MDAEGRPDVRWMRVAERGGDRNEDAGRGKDVEEEEEEEERRERKGVRVRVRLGVGGAIRNYCGTIDKRRLRGRTTEDSLRPSDFPSTFHLPPSSVASPFRFFSLFLLLDFHSCVMPFHPYPCLAPRNLPDSSICNVREPARATPPSSGRSTWNRRFYPTLYISVDAPSKPRWDRSTL